MTQLVDLSAAQDVEAGDGTTSVVVLAGSLLGAAEKMLQKGIHPTIVAESFMKASTKAVDYLTEMSKPVDLSDKANLLRAASTSLNSKVRDPFSRVVEITHLLVYSCTDCIPILFNPCTYCRSRSDALDDSHLV
jgi:chaperonin GroEL (HSP60 family)